MTAQEEILTRLEVKPLRLWQVSQMALSGMVAGLLKQPGTVRVPLMPGEEGREELRRKISRLEQELTRTLEMVVLLREMPAWKG